jgi:hypothetical protein
MAAMTTSGNHTDYTADMDRSATPGQTAEVQRLFDEIGLDAQVSASYTTKSTAGDVVEAVLWLGGAGVARAYLHAAGTFGDDLGHYVAKRVTDRFEQLRQARGRQVTTIIQDPSIGVEIIIVGDEPPEAFEQLNDLLNHDKIKDIPGRAAAIRWREGEGWIRPF